LKEPEDWLLGAVSIHHGWNASAGAEAPGPWHSALGGDIAESIGAHAARTGLSGLCYGNMSYSLAVDMLVGPAGNAEAHDGSINGVAPRRASF
jgi:hypothetical protein